jgi:hypothetical protein
VVAHYVTTFLLSRPISPQEAAAAAFEALPGDPIGGLGDWARIGHTSNEVVVTVMEGRKIVQLSGVWTPDNAADKQRMTQAAQKVLATLS